MLEYARLPVRVPASYRHRRKMLVLRRTMTGGRGPVAEPGPIGSLVARGKVASRHSG
jgi:hypothetical protein